MEENALIVKFNTDSGDIIAYAVVGLHIPDEIPNGEGYVHWRGVEPNPIYNYKVQDGEVVLKSEADRQVRVDTINAAVTRESRNKLLTVTDYVILPDAPYSDETQSAYRVYRQELRDLPEQ